MDCTVLSHIPYPDVQKEGIQKFSGNTPAFVLYSFADITDAKTAQEAVNEALLAQIDKKQALHVSCDGEKEMLAGINFFFSKMAYFNEVISTWHKEMARGKELTEEMISGVFSKIV